MMYVHKFLIQDIPGIITFRAVVGVHTEHL